jgi:hypothetical protein
VKIVFLLSPIIFFGCLSSSGSIGPIGPQGPKGDRGLKGIQGMQGPKGERGEKGKGLTPSKLKELDNIIIKGSKMLGETIVGATAYSFGFAPKVTGFAYLSSSGKIYKLENKNPRTLGENLKYFSKIEGDEDFISIEKSVYGEDVKQFFTAVNIVGEVFVSEDLKEWSKVSTINLK